MPGYPQRIDMAPKSPWETPNSCMVELTLP